MKKLHILFFVLLFSSCGNWKTKMIKEYSDITNYLSYTVQINAITAIETVCNIGFKTITDNDCYLTGGFITADMYNTVLSNGFTPDAGANYVIRICPHIHFDGGNFPICSIQSEDMTITFISSDYGISCITEWAKNIK